VQRDGIAFADDNANQRERRMFRSTPKNGESNDLWLC